MVWLGFFLLVFTESFSPPRHKVIMPAPLTRPRQPVHIQNISVSMQVVVQRLVAEKSHREMRVAEMSSYNLWLFSLRTRLGRCYCVAAKSNKLSVYNDSSDSIVSRWKHVENIPRPLLVSRLSLTKNWNCNSRHSHRCFFPPPEDKIQVHLDLIYIERLCWKHFMDVEWDLPLEQSKVGGPSDRACQVFTVTAWR